MHLFQWYPLILNISLPLFLSHLDLSPAPTSPQYTSKSCPLTIPCSIHVSWDQIKAKGIQEGNWHFIPKPGSSLTPHGSQRLFSLSLEDKLAWKADQNRGLTTASDLTKGNLSLMRKQGREDDSGDYVCSLNFKNGLTLNRTVQVKVLQSKSKQIVLYKHSLCCTYICHIFFCSLVFTVSSFIFLKSGFFLFPNCHS